MSEIQTFQDLVGKTIASATHMKLSNYDDEGFLRLTFSDASECVIYGGYGSYTGDSEDAYQTVIGLRPHADGLVPISPPSSPRPEAVTPTSQQPQP